MTDGERIKQIRTELGLSQTRFGFKFHISPMNISMWETGRNRPTEYTMYMIEKILELEKKVEEYEEIIKQTTAENSAADDKET